MQSGKTVTRPLSSAGAMWTSAELYFATTSQPAMQLPQKWQAGRVLVGTVSVALRTWITCRAQRPRRPPQDLVAALQRDRRQEYAVGQILEPVAVAADADFALDRVVVGRDVLVVDRPVLAGAFERAPLEVPLAEPQRDGVPEHRLAADAAAALRIEPGLARPHRRNLAGGEVERHRVRVEVGARVHARTALDDRDPHAAPGEVRGERAARRAGADDDDVEDVGLHARVHDCVFGRGAASTEAPFFLPVKDELHPTRIWRWHASMDSTSPTSTVPR